MCAHQDVFIAYEGRFYKHDYNRLRTLTNTVDSPADYDAGDSQACPSVPRTFLNSDTCVQRPECAPTEYSSTEFTLDATVIREFYTRERRFVYYIDGLRVDESPCDGTQRWRRRIGACTNDMVVNAATLQALESALRSSDDSNPLVRDVSVDSDLCSFEYASEALRGVRVGVDGVCWEHR